MGGRKTQLPDILSRSALPTHFKEKTPPSSNPKKTANLRQVNHPKSVSHNWRQGRAGQETTKCDHKHSKAIFSHALHTWGATCFLGAGGRRRPRGSPSAAAPWPAGSPPSWPRPSSAAGTACRSTWWCSPAAGTAPPEEEHRTTRRTGCLAWRSWDWRTDLGTPSYF